MDPLTNPAIPIIGALLPVLIMLVKQQAFSTTTNMFIAYAVYAIAGVLGVILSGETLDITNLVPLITIFAVVGSTTYQTFWSSIGANPATGALGFDARVTNFTSIFKAAPAAA